MGCSPWGPKRSQTQLAPRESKINFKLDLYLPLQGTQQSTWHTVGSRWMHEYMIYCFLLESETCPELSRCQESSPGSSSGCYPSPGEGDNPLTSSAPVSPPTVPDFFPQGSEGRWDQEWQNLWGGESGFGGWSLCSGLGILVESGSSGLGPVERICHPPLWGPWLLRVLLLVTWSLPDGCLRKSK